MTYVIAAYSISALILVALTVQTVYSLKSKQKLLKQTNDSKKMAK